jgi:hypothetical protein
MLVHKGHLHNQPFNPLSFMNILRNLASYSQDQEDNFTFPSVEGRPFLCQWGLVWVNMFLQLIFKFFIYCTISLNPMKSSPTNPTHQGLVFHKTMQYSITLALQISTWGHLCAPLLIQGFQVHNGGTHHGLLDFNVTNQTHRLPSLVDTKARILCLDSL